MSCYNREREYLVGANAKGQVPVRAIPVFEMEVSFSGREVRMNHVSSASEAALVAIRMFAVSVVRPVMRIPRNQEAVATTGERFRKYQMELL